MVTRKKIMGGGCRGTDRLRACAVRAGVLCTLSFGLPTIESAQCGGAAAPAHGPAHATSWCVGSILSPHLEWCRGYSTTWHRCTNWCSLATKSMAAARTSAHRPYHVQRVQRRGTVASRLSFAAATYDDAPQRCGQGALGKREVVLDAGCETGDAEHPTKIAAFVAAVSRVEEDGVKLEGSVGKADVNSDHRGFSCGAASRERKDTTGSGAGICDAATHYHPGSETHTYGVYYMAARMPHNELPYPSTYSHTL